MGPFENRNCPLIDVNHRQPRTIITTNIIAAPTNVAKTAYALRDENLDNAARTLYLQRIGTPSKIPYAVDIAIREDLQHVASLFCRLT